MYLQTQVTIIVQYANIYCTKAFTQQRFIYLCRKRSTHKNAGNSNNIAVSANMAYGEVSLKPEMMVMEGEYENPDKILKPSAQRNETTTASNYETIDTSK